MLRTLVLTLAIAAPGAAQAQERFRDSAVGAEVVSDTGVVVGRVEHVVRDRDGRVIAAEISEQEPASAPYASNELVASADPSMLVAAGSCDDLHRPAPTRERQATRGR